MNFNLAFIVFHCFAQAKPIFAQAKQFSRARYALSPQLSRTLRPGSRKLMPPSRKLKRKNALAFAHTFSRRLTLISPARTSTSVFDQIIDFFILFGIDS
ncbi:hypothetical protein QL285_012056 [Trifolium repens]|nr:hypothetical protein QL285_012056 [Trifolium repens]